MSGETKKILADALGEVARETAHLQRSYEFFKTIVPITEESIVRLTDDQKDRVDTVNRCEALGIIDSADAWLGLREMRNHFIHEYPQIPLIRAMALNRVFDGTPLLLTASAKTQAFCMKQFAICASHTD